MAVHRVAFSRAVLAAVLQGTITCTLRGKLPTTPGDILLGGLAGQPPLVRLKVTGFRRQVPFQELTKRELQRAGIRDPQSRADALAELGPGPNPTVNVIHFRIMKKP